MAGGTELQLIMEGVYSKFVQLDTPEAEELNKNLVSGTNETHKEYALYIFPSEEPGKPWGLMGTLRDGC